MKKGIVLLLSILVFAGCSGQKKATDSTIKAEYKAYSRGFYQVVTIENQMVFITKTRDEKPVAFKIPIADWKITKQGKTYESQSFDHGYPPAETEKIVNKILSFVK